MVTEIFHRAEHNHRQVFWSSVWLRSQENAQWNPEQRLARDWTPRFFFSRTCWNASSEERNTTVHIRPLCQRASKRRQKQVPGWRIAIHLPPSQPRKVPTGAILQAGLSTHHRSWQVSPAETGPALPYAFNQELCDNEGICCISDTIILPTHPTSNLLATNVFGLHFFISKFVALAFCLKLWF